MKRLKELSLLFVEDETVMQKTIERILSKHLKRFTLAINGEEGIEKYNSVKPDIIITDLDMPVMNGSVMISEIRKIDKNIPIIIITAFSDQAEKISGADFCLIKPINKNKLFELLDMCVQKLNIVSSK